MCYILLELPRYLSSKMHFSLQNLPSPQYQCPDSCLLPSAIIGALSPRASHPKTAIASYLLKIFGDAKAIEEHLPRGSGLLPRQHLEGGGLSGPIEPKQSKTVPALDCDGDISHGQNDWTPEIDLKKIWDTQESKEYL